MRHPLLIAALTLTAFGGSAAQAEAYSLPGIQLADGGAATSGRSLDAEEPDAKTPPGTLKLVDMENDGRGHDDDGDDDDEHDDDEDEMENDAAGASPDILPIPGSGAPATAPAPKNPLINGNGRPSVVVQ